jgi:glycosyltransferase involved in cell wall biosynthesis
MHIAIVDTVTNPQKPGGGGLSDINWSLARELARLGERVTMIGPYESTIRNPEPSVGFVRVPEVAFKRTNITTLVRTPLGLAARGKAIRDVDVYHVPDSLTAAALALHGLGARTVWHGNANVLFYSDKKNPWDRSLYLLMRAATAFAAPRVSRVVALGENVVPWWEQSGVPHDRIAIIPYGVDVSSDQSVATVFRTPADDVWDRHTYRLLYVGRLSPEKRGYFELIETLDSLRMTMSIGFVLIGDGPQRPAVEEAIRRRGLGGTVCCIGQQPRHVIDRAYRRADLVVLPTYADMMPRVMLEAWAIGAPFMATAVGAIPDYLVDSQNGFLLTSLEHDYLCSRLRAVLENPSARLRAAQGGKATARSLPWSISATQFRSVYRSVVSELTLKQPAPSRYGVQREKHIIERGNGVSEEG